MIEQLKLRIKIIEIKLAILLLKKKLTIPNLPKPRFIFIHHGGGDWNFYQVNNHHTNKWGFISSLGFGCGYQYFIEFDGRIHQARRDNECGAHTIGNVPKYYNRNSIGICLQGNYERIPPTQSQLRSLEDLVNKKKAEYNIPKNRILGHKEVADTICPGSKTMVWLCIYREQ